MDFGVVGDFLLGTVFLTLKRASFTTLALD